jgi:two-component sensor histidine kinase
MRRTQVGFRTHLAAVGMLAAIPFVVGGASISYLYVSGERVQTERRLIGSARDTLSSIERELAGALIALRTLALSEPLARGDFQAFQRQAEEAVKLLPESAIVLRRPDGQQIVNTVRSWGTSLPVSKDSAILAADKAALERNAHVFSGVYFGTTSRQSFVAVNFPVTADDKPYLLNIALPTRAILKLISSQTLVPSDWLVIVLDENYRVIARTRDHDNFAGKNASAPFVARLIGKEGTLRSTTLDGVPVLNGYAKSPFSGWTVIVAAPQQAIDQPLRTALMAVAVIGAFGVMGSIVLALLYGRYITPPILRMRDEALKLGRREPVASFRTGVAEFNAVSEALATAAHDLAREGESNRQLINELNHRVKNTLASVQAIANQTARRAASLPEFTEAFTGRLVALSKAHDALSDTGWIAVDLRSLVDQICGASGDEARFRLEGPSAALSTRAALTLGLVLHELCTNASKYGALSGVGRVHVRWTVSEQDRLMIDWVESGGPAVKAPEKTGFGTGFIRRSIEAELGGSVRFNFSPDGLSAHIELPLKA